MRLEDWRKKVRKGRAFDAAIAFRKFVGSTKTDNEAYQQWRFWETGAVAPSVRMVYAIQVFTKGLVSIEDWLSEEERAFN